MAKHHNRILRSFIFLVASIVFTSCATIIGGSKYYAHIEVVGHPEASIFIKNRLVEKGSATLLLKRKHANKLTISVREENCEEQTFFFRRRKLRGWAIAGTLNFTGLEGGVPLPWGLVIDLITGSIWKPDITEKGLSKTNLKHYNYKLDYTTGCKTKVDKEVIIFQQKPTLLENAKNKADRLREMKKLLDEGILSQEEYDKEKAKILEEK